MNDAGRRLTVDEIVKDLTMLEYQAARRGMYLTVHAIHRAKQVLTWESKGDREKALQAETAQPVEDEQ